jgi:hypothetical protein
MSKAHSNKDGATTYRAKLVGGNWSVNQPSFFGHFATQRVIANSLAAIAGSQSFHPPARARPSGEPIRRNERQVSAVVQTALNGYFWVTYPAKRRLTDVEKALGLFAKVRLQGSECLSRSLSAYQKKRHDEFVRHQTCAIYDCACPPFSTRATTHCLRMGAPVDR